MTTGHNHYMEPASGDYPDGLQYPSCNTTKWCNRCTIHPIILHGHAIGGSENNRIYAHDTFAGRFPNIYFDPSTGIRIAWRTKQTTLHFTPLIGSADARVLIGTEKPVVDFFSFPDLTAFTDHDEQVVWRDPKTVRIDNLPPMSSGILGTPGYIGVAHDMALDGDIYESLVQ